jgi:hypothetical protein
MPVLVRYRDSKKMTPSKSIPALALKSLKEASEPKKGSLKSRNKNASPGIKSHPQRSTDKLG